MKFLLCFHSIGAESPRSGEFNNWEMIMIRKVAVLAFLVFSGIMTLSCSDGPVESPVEPQLARKVKPPAAAPVLEEFWVHRDADSFCAGEIIHIVASGEFLRIATTVAHDHFFNGVRDLGLHFEYGFLGPDAPETEWNAEGLGHVDVCFQGEQTDHTYPGGEVAYGLFVDYPSTSVGGTGADPFAIYVGVTTSEKRNGSEGKGFRPTGVIVDGSVGLSEETVASGTSVWHTGQDFGVVRSYAVWQSPPPKGYLFFDELTLVDASCQVVTSIEGKGKNKREVTATTVTASVAVRFGAQDLATTGLIWDQSHWTEGHLRIVPSNGEPRISDRYRIPGQDGVTTYSWSIADDQLVGQEFEVEFLADFLIASAAANPWAGDNVFDYVYDPSQNHSNISTTAGFDGLLNWDATVNVSKSIGDGLFPVAHSYSDEPVVVTCGGG